LIPTVMRYVLRLPGSMFAEAGVRTIWSPQISEIRAFDGVTRGDLADRAPALRQPREATQP